jgi:hypothetical protein
MSTKDIPSRIKSGEIDAQFAIDGKPYFLMEKDVGKGVFYVAKAITIDRDSWWGESEKGLGELVLGKDIIETSTKDLHLLVDRKPREPYELELQRVVCVLRHLAEISNHDYVSFVPYANGISDTIFSEEGELVKVTPRLFKSNSDIVNSRFRIEMQPIPVEEILGYSGNKEIDMIAREMRENDDLQGRAQAIIDMHYNARHYQSYQKKN